MTIASPYSPRLLKGTRTRLEVDITKNKNIRYAYSDEEMQAITEEIGKKGVDLQRYKGLGEMNAIQLWDTTMDPEHRILLQVTMDDAVLADEIFNTLMGEKPELRREFINNNAKLVAELDV